MNLKTSKICNLALPTALLLGFAATSATAANITVYPGDNTPDTADAIGAPGQAAPGFASGSFQANGTNKSDIYIGGDSLFNGSTVKIGQLSSLSYSTNQDVPDSGTPVNWYINIYTKKDGTDDDGFYGRRLTLEPYFAENRNETDNTWVRWSTEGANNKLRVSDANRGASGDVHGTYTDPFLSDITGGPINWNNYNNAYEDATFDYRDEEISLISLSTGSAWASGFDGLLDGFSIDWTENNEPYQSTVNFEANAVTDVAEPPMLVLLGLAIIGLGVTARRRQHG